MRQALRWRKVSDYCIQAGRYLIALVYSAGHEWYVLHAGEEKIGMWEGDPAAAKQAAQEHYDKNAG